MRLSQRRARLSTIVENSLALVPPRSKLTACKLWEEITYGDKWLAISDEGLPYVSWGTPVTRDNDARRLKTRLGRYMTKHMGVDPAIAGDIVSTMTEFSTVRMDRFEFLSGPEVMRAYKNSFGSGSCMTGADAHLTELYEINPDKVGMLTYNDGSRDYRALLWLDDTCKIMMVDRPYPETEQGRTIFQEWARQRGAHYRYDVPPSFAVTLDLPHSEEMPYMDTLVNGTRVGYDKVKVQFEETYSTVCCTSTSGGPWAGTACYDCGDHMAEDEWYEHDGALYCRDCYWGFMTECAECGEVVPSDATYYVESTGSICEDCRDHSFTECEHCDELVRNDDLVGDKYCSSVCARAAGNVKCAECGDWTDDYVVVDDHYFCDANCAESYGHVQCPTCNEWNNCDCEEKKDEKASV